MKPWLVVGLVAILAASAASAETIDYTITGDASGTFTNASGVTSDFTDVPVIVVAVGDTSTQIVDPGFADFVLLSSATVTGGGLTRSIGLGSGTYFAVPNPPDSDPGPAAFFTVISGVAEPVALFEGDGLGGYNGVSDIGPLDVTFEGVAPLMLGNDEVVLSDFSDATFSASLVPEPAAWAMMLAGIGAAGAGLRRRRARA